MPVASLMTLAAGLITLLPTHAAAQQESKPAYLSFEIIAPPGAGSRVHSQEWGRVFQKLGHSVRIRTQTAADGTGPRESVTETESATSRRIKAVGLLDAKGNVHFGTRRFSSRDTARLKAWIDSLKKYGKQGDPSGQPLWGLKAEVFGKLYDAIATPLEVEVKGKPVTEAVTAMRFPPQHPVVWDDDARQIAARASEVTRELKLIGRPTALAMVLNDAGLGFYPQRQPNGSVSLRIAKQSSEPHWPVGWRPKLSVARTVPGFFNQIEVELPDIGLERLFGTISERTQVPIRVDHYHIRAKGLEFDKMKIRVDRRKMSWNRVVQTASIRNRLNYDIRVDELGKPFVWVSTPEVIKARRDRLGSK